MNKSIRCPGEEVHLPEPRAPRFVPGQATEDWVNERVLHLLTLLWPNDPAQQPRPRGELGVGESLHAAGVCCSRWFGVQGLGSEMEYLELQDVLPRQLPHEERGGHAHQRNLVVLRVGR